MSPRKPKPKIKTVDELASMPSLWCEGDDLVPVLDTYTVDPQDAIKMAVWATGLGLCFRLDSYIAPISDEVGTTEAHLIVFRQIAADASIVPRPEEPPRPGEPTMDLLERES
jgi:hypothetical protein